MLPRKSDIPKLETTKPETASLTSLNQQNDLSSLSTQPNQGQDGKEQLSGRTPNTGQPKMLDTKSYLERMRQYHELGLVDQQGKPKSDRFIPLDLSGQKRKVESPLDLTVKTTRRCADTTQDLDQIMNSDLKSRPLLNGSSESSPVPRNPRKEKLLAYKQQCGAQQTETPVQAVVQVESKAEVPVKLLNAYHTSSRRYLLTADGLKSEAVSRGGLGGSVASLQGGTVAVERSFDTHDGGVKFITKPIPRELIQNNNSAFGTYNLMQKDLMKKPTKVTITRASSPDNQETVTGFQPIRPAPLRVMANIPAVKPSTLSPGASRVIQPNGLNGITVDINHGTKTPQILPQNNNNKDSKPNCPAIIDMTAKSDVSSKRTTVHSDNGDSGKGVSTRPNTRTEAKEVKNDKSSGENNRSLKSGDVPTTKKLSVSVKQMSTEGLRKAMRTPPKAANKDNKSERKSSRNSSPEKRSGRQTPDRGAEKKGKKTPDRKEKNRGEEKTARTPETRQKSPVKRSPAERRAAREEAREKTREAEAREAAREAREAREREARETRESREARQNQNGLDDAVSSSDERDKSGRNTPSGRGRKRTLLEKLNDGNGFILDQKRRKASSSLDVDPATLGREERLLRHALLRFDTLEAKSSSPDPPSQEEKDRKRKRERPAEPEETVRPAPTPTPPPRNTKVPNSSSKPSCAPSTKPASTGKTKGKALKKTRQQSEEAVPETDDVPPSPKPKKAKKVTNKKSKPKQTDSQSSDDNTDREDKVEKIDKTEKVAKTMDKTRRKKKLRKVEKSLPPKTDSENENDGDNENEDDKRENDTGARDTSRTEPRHNDDDVIDDEESDESPERSSPELRPRKLKKTTNSRLQRAKSDWKRRKVQQAKKWSNKKKVKLRKEFEAGTSREQEYPDYLDDTEPMDDEDYLLAGDCSSREGTSRDGTPSKTRERSHSSMDRSQGSVDMKRLVVNKTSGETALHRAGRLNYKDVALHLLQTGAVDVNARDNAGYTALHECTVKGNVAIAKHLINFGAEVNAAAADGTRPIHDAVDNHQLEVVRLLLACGADPTLATYSGRTTFKLARTHKMREFMTGYMKDMNQCAPEMGDPTDDPLPWEFDGSSTVNDPHPMDGQDLFEDVPGADVTQTEMEFEFYSEPPPELYRVTLPGDKDAQDLFLLHDILTRVSLSRQQLMETHPKVCMDIKRIKTCQLAHECPQLKSSLQNQRSPSQFTELIPLTPALKELLDCQTIVVDYFSGEMYEERVDDEADAKSTASDATEIYGEMDNDEEEELAGETTANVSMESVNTSNTSINVPTEPTQNSIVANNTKANPEAALIDLTRNDTVINIINEKIDNAVKRDFAQDLSLKSSSVVNASSQPAKPAYNPYLHQPYRTESQAASHVPTVTTQSQQRTFMPSYPPQQTTPVTPTTSSYPGYGQYSAYYPYRAAPGYAAYDAGRSQALSMSDYSSSPYLPISTQAQYPNRYSLTTAASTSAKSPIHYSGYNRPQPSRPVASSEPSRTLPSAYTMPYSGGTSYPLTGYGAPHLPASYPSSTYGHTVPSQSSTTASSSYMDSARYGTYLPTTTKPSPYAVPSKSRESSRERVTPRPGYMDGREKEKPEARTLSAHASPAIGGLAPPFGHSSAIGGHSNSAVGGHSPAIGGHSSAIGGHSSAIAGHSSTAIGGHSSAIPGHSSSIGGSSSAIGGHPSSTIPGHSSAIGGHSSAIGGSSTLGSHSSSLGAHATPLGPPPVSLSSHSAPRLGTSPAIPPSTAGNQAPALGSSISDARSLPRASPAADLLRADRSVLAPSLDTPPSYRTLLDLAPPLPPRTPLSVVPTAPAYRNYPVLDPRYYRGQSMEASLSSPLSFAPPPGLVTSQAMTSQLPSTPPGLIPGPPALLNVGSVTSTVASYAAPLTSPSLAPSRMLPANTYPALAPHLSSTPGLASGPPSHLSQPTPGLPGHLSQPAPGLPGHPYASMYQAGARHAEQYLAAQQSMRHRESLNFYLNQHKYAMEMEKYARAPAAAYAPHSSLSHSSLPGGLGPSLPPSLDMSAPKPAESPYPSLNMTPTEEYYLKQRMGYLPRRLSGAPSTPGSLAPPTPPTAHGYPYL